MDFESKMANAYLLSYPVLVLFIEESKVKVVNEFKPQPLTVRGWNGKWVDNEIIIPHDFLPSLVYRKDVRLPVQLQRAMAAEVSHNIVIIRLFY